MTILYIAGLQGSKTQAEDTLKSLFWYVIGNTVMCYHLVEQTSPERSWPLSSKSEYAFLQQVSPQPRLSLESAVVASGLWLLAERGKTMIGLKGKKCIKLTHKTKVFVEILILI